MRKLLSLTNFSAFLLMISISPYSKQKSAIMSWRMGKFKQSTGVGILSFRNQLQTHLPEARGSKVQSYILS